ncbi:MAG: tetratricopeptide repeat protein [Gammaproteobacteria bacterium]|nr:tetratricopeptide repeat protein [Gammaproteobacteria bacterium]
MLVTLVLLVGCASAQALTLHYDPARDPRLVSCDQLSETGETAAAKSCFEELLAVDDDLIRAESARALGQVRLANRLFRELAAASDDPYFKVRWGQLFLETHQVADAAALFRESLLRTPDYVPALVGLAEAQGRQFEGQARQTLYNVIEADPESLHALLLLARLDLESQRLDEAKGLLDAALELATRTGAPVLEIHALYTAMDLLQGNPDSEWIDKALEINPHYGDIYAIPAHFYIITYRYREAVDLYQRAVKIEPTLHSARSKLGINLLRINDVFGARYHLERAYAGDPYNTETVNTLRLLDDMDDMRVSFKDVPALDNPDETIGRVIVKLDREDADALEPYVLALSVDAVQTFTERYDFHLKKPVTVELFHNHDDFGVRTVSTPGVGLLGVTFGYVLAMDSPRARPAGDFHWASTLWHELAHVFTLEAANHLLPRWFSEGLSVYEEWRTGPLAGRELPLQVFQMLNAGRFLPLAELDNGFVRPTYEGQVSVSYMQAGLLCDFISDRWGHGALVSMLHAFGRGDNVKTVVNRYLEVTLNEFDEAFITHVRSRYENTLARLDEFQQLPRVLANSMRNSDWPGAEQLAQQLIDIYPDFVSAGNGYLALAHAQAEQGRDRDATQTRLRWFRHGGYDPETLRQLAIDLDEQGSVSAAAEVLAALNWVSPYYASEHEKLGQYYLTLEQPDKALQSFDALIGLSEDHAASAWLGKSRAQRQLGEMEKARRSVLIALEQAPFFRDAQRLLLELNAGETLD